MNSAISVAELQLTLDDKCYTAHLDERGNLIGVEASFYGYRGRLTFRPCKRDGAAWRRVAKAVVKERK